MCPPVNVLEAPECAISWAGAHPSAHTQLCVRHLIPGAHVPCQTQGSHGRRGDKLGTRLRVSKGFKIQYST